MTTRQFLIWAALCLTIGLPVVLAAYSPYLAFRSAVYITGGFAGIFALAILLVQPLLARGFLPGLAGRRGRSVHRAIGIFLVLAVFAHVAGLWLTSPPDVIDALLFRSPTPFSVWGVVAMWAVFAAGTLAVFRHRLWLTPIVWRRVHKTLVLVVVVGSVVHALLIEGAMEPWSKALLCVVVALATVLAVSGFRWPRR